MSDFSIQNNRAYASAYASNIGAAPVTPVAATPPSISTADSVSISSQAQRLFQMSIVEEPVTPMNGGGIRPPDEPPAKPVKD